MARKSTGNPDKVPCAPKINQEKSPSQEFIKNFLKNYAEAYKKEVEITNAVNHIFHCLELVEKIDSIFNRLSDDNLGDDSLVKSAPQKLEQVKQACIGMAGIQSEALNKLFLRKLKLLLRKKTR